MEHPFEQTALKALVAVLGLSICAYLYFVCASVLNVMAQREANRTAQASETSIGTLEQQYFALSHEVTEENAEIIGLVPIAKTDYVYRPGPVGVASVSSNAI